MRPFDPIATPLKGPCLIEAGAGTGKTFTITTLVLRLVLQKGLTPEQILVVTFTTAAAAELRDRLRRRLREAKHVLQGESHDGSSAMTDLLSACGPRDLAIQRLEDALANFDRMPVFTIHGFCQRVLTEMAFETGGSFEADLVTDTTTVVQEIADDFWRKIWDGTAPEFIAFALQRLKSPEELAGLYHCYAVPELALFPDSEGGPIIAWERYRELRAQACSLWHGDGDAILELLASPDLKANIYGRPDPPPGQPGAPSKREEKCRSWGRLLDRWTAAEAGGFPPPDPLVFFTRTKLDASLKKGGRCLEHAFFDVCDALWRESERLFAAMEAWLSVLKVRFFRYVAQSLRRHKREQQVLFFDDLLLMVRDALRRDTGGALQQCLRNRYRAALIDEFQDTDGVQYEIFDRLFGSGDPPLFMIGDPKQAIYRFRGADIFTYLRAARRAGHRYTLTVNWRSTPAMVRAVNLLFEQSAIPFLWPAIAFQPATAAPMPSQTSSGDDPSPALTVWYVSKSKNGTGSASWTKQTATAAIGESLALAIRGMATTTGKGTSRRTYGDMAVLVRTNRQARDIKRYLSEAGVPAAVYRAGSVYHGREALDLQRLLEAVANPGDDVKLRTALCTPLLGRRGEALDFRAEVPDWWEATLEVFFEYRTLWIEKGFIHMFRRLLVQEEIAPRLLADPSGERHLTNLLHLAELLHQSAVDRRLNPDELIQWLALQRQQPHDATEAHQLRLESDADAVAIMTVHKSKGLEFPVVFCPFAWEGMTRPAPPAHCHGDGNGPKRVLDFGSSDLEHHLGRMAEEQMAEELRLLYVAVTRAKRRCYLVWGALPTTASSALAYLLAPEGGPPREPVTWEVLQSMAKTFQDQAPGTHRRALMTLARHSQGAIAVDDLPMGRSLTEEASASPLLLTPPRPYTRGPFPVWTIASFSSLVHHRQDSGEMMEDLPDRLDVPQGRPPGTHALPQSPSIGVIADFEAGARAGLLFHDILEHIDFCPATQASWDVLVEDRLQAHGYGLQWKHAILDMLANIVDTLLSPGEAPAFTLRQIQGQDRLTEMAFHLPLGALEADSLGRVFSACRQADFRGRLPGLIQQLAFSLDGGYLKGYIDLVFRHDGRYYLVDWKSNLLGDTYAAYRPERLADVMAAEFYFLQYHLYALALDGFLRASCPGYTYASNFGGVFYCFIRGMRPSGGTPTGIFFDRPSEPLMRRLREKIVNEKK